MWRYLLKRILIFAPTMAFITLISFTISQNAPGDPVEQMLGGQNQANGLAGTKTAATEEQYLRLRNELGLNLPLFYFSLATLAEPETFASLPKPAEVKVAKRLTLSYGNWPQVERYMLSLRLFRQKVAQLSTQNANFNTVLAFQAKAAVLQQTYLPQNIEELLKEMRQGIERNAEAMAGVAVAFSNLETAFSEMKNEATVWKTYLPVVYFHGYNNQYHRWLVKLLTLDFGRSYVDHRPVAEKLGDALVWTLIINFISILLAYLIAIPLGVFSARNRYTLKDNLITAKLFMLYSLPNFWIATLLIIFLGGGDYLNWFPNNGVQNVFHSESWSWPQRLADWAYHLILPVFCFTYASLAYLSRQTRAAMLETLNQDYIRTARAKGLDEKTVVWKHAFRNSLIPMITLFASVFPAMVGGSVILETIFSIPGMGFLSFNALTFRDYPTIVAVFTLSGLLTLVGVLVADILYAVADPRITFSKNAT